MTKGLLKKRGPGDGLHHEWMNLGQHHAGVIVSSRRSIGDVLRRLISLSQSLASYDMEDRLEYLSNW